jgi:dUTP pyrophosphatase
MTVWFFKTSPLAILPKYAHGREDAGMDLYFCGETDSESFLLDAGERTLVSTGLKIALPEGYEGQVRSRSGLAAKHGVIVLNAPGTVDPGYRGELKVLLMNTSRYGSVKISHGDRIAQLVVAPVTHAEVCLAFNDPEEVNATKRSGNGFGSTGK